jgi:E3 ubiquitin-protein ligase HUWE1
MRSHGVINVSSELLAADRPLDALTQRFQIQLDAAGDFERRTRRLIEGLMMTELGRRHPPVQAAPQATPERVRTDPVSIVHYEVGLTVNRWLEEAKMIFGLRIADIAGLLLPELNRRLVPRAIKLHREEEQRAKLEREEQEARERKAREELEAQEKKMREEREAKEQEERAAREAAEAAAAAAAAEEAERAAEEAHDAENEENEMQGVETSQAGEPQVVAESSATAGPTPRVTYRLRDREIDLTSLGIDPEFLDAIPPEMREEVLIAQVMQHRASLGQGSAEAPRFDEEFLAALPPEMREEIIQAEAMELRRQQREEARRRQAGPAQTEAVRGAEEMNPEDFLASLTSDLRQQILMEADEDMLATLPDHIVAEARALGGGRSRGMPQLLRRRGNTAGDPSAAAGIDPTQPVRPSFHYLQIFEKSGISSLLRLIFMPQQGSVKALFKEILSAACQNRQNRAEIVSILLSILQDGSADAGAIERSFAQLSSKAKQSGSTAKSPHLKRSESIAMSEMTPLRVVSQCLETLEYLISHNPKAMLQFMLTEHDPGMGFRPRSTGKGKGKDSRAARFPINAVLGLLNRKLIVENTPVLDVLSHLSQEITAHIVKISEDVNKHLKGQEKEAEKAAAGKEESAKADNAGQEQDSNGQEAPAQASGDAAQESKAEQGDEKTKKARPPPIVPEISEHNMRLVVSVIGSRELSSRSFKNILAMISSLSVLPKAKTIFGSELIRVAEELGASILRDLKVLLEEVRKADSASELQRVALARFSPASSDQTKLLRVITSLDYIFDPVRSALHTPFPSDEPKSTDDESETLRTLYENATFSPLWKTLSLCLSAIRDHKSTNMLNIATFLLPLIEVLMFVFKSSVRKTEKTPAEGMGSPVPDSQMEAFFYRFTEDHRKILNELVRQNPKLMSGSFDLMVRNSKVLEFDNKRNYFHRQLHPRSNEPRHPHGQLQMTVRRESIFHDSYRSLYYKKPEEIKFGKLNIKFQDEEGVDAGGVTREWFHELVKQMFNPDYVLFNPIASDRTTFHPNPLSGINSEHLSFFQFVGRIIGKALYESRHLDCHFSQAVYKRILGREVSVKDMEAHDLAYYGSLKWILENDITGEDFTFSAEFENFGSTKVVDLIENGRKEIVTNENKKEYVRLMVNHKLVGSVSEQLDALLKGKLVTIAFCMG